MKYLVHLYPTFRVTVEVEAESQVEAIEAAYKGIDFDVFNQNNFEFADEVSYALVDEDGDQGYNKTKGYKTSFSGWEEDQ